MKLRYYILALLLLFGLVPLILAVLINLPLVVERTAMFYQKAYLQNLRADFRDLDQHLASRDEIIRLLAKLPDPEILLGTLSSEQQIELTRARYTSWINQMLSDQGDIIQILFLDHHGQERFWLERNAQDRQWRQSENPPEPPNFGFINAAAKLQPGEVMVSRIRVNPYASSRDPRRLLTLQLASPIGEPKKPGGPALGLLLMTVDVGGLAKFYRNTLWVHHRGSYLVPGQPISDAPQAFTDFPGLEQVFAEGKLALSKSTAGEPYLWVPMFLTEDALPLWVGRPVDSSPIADFRNTLIVRVLSIVLVLVLVVMVMARTIARRAERFGRELTAGVQHILRAGEPLQLQWRGPFEVRELGEQLSALSRSHSEHIASERQHTRELERSNRYKSEFLANVSHELRTPLNAILLLSKMLADQESGLEGEQRRQAQVIHEASRDLRGLIDNILDISRIEAGQVAMHLEWVDLPSMLEELANLTEAIFTAKDLPLELEIAPNVPTRIYSDRDKIRQIIKNFLSNAAKFTHQGRVLITAEAHSDPKYPVAISVSDTGIGIPPGKEEIIFDAFQQADGSTRRRYGGTGLGLSISRELAGLLNGKISVDSALGQGSRFTLALPLSLGPDQLDGMEVTETHNTPISTHLIPINDDSMDDDLPEDMPKDDMRHGNDNPGKRRTKRWDTESARQRLAQANLGNRWILLLERDVQSLLDLTAYLKDFGLRVQAAADVDEALEALNEEPDCALILFAALPEPGRTCDSIARLRADPAGAQFPVIVMGPPKDDALQDYLAAGATAFFSKPLAADDLIELIDRLVAQEAESDDQRDAPTQDSQT
ncbi:ATP-binding response regulator [Thiorhodovibrio frisius]|uniref:histidine kinase n=1 Tax=Thiorhodovibrio frisius TaxID=631362 RepID=H8YY12_9GAMM|nr:ATP-binding protein [Thiorhodovibrio frisius]EIC23338.1 signal transduction histidine kinase [Thiorhodovibrio frisius]WPL23582.1 Autoinducer 2 sensor kinase/phosphatase LuxQ [Thiorhodovibrio frisius]